MSKICFTITSLSSLSRVSFISSLSSCVSSLSSPAFSRRRPAFSCRYSPAFPHHSSLPLAIDSQTLSTTYLVQHSNPLVLDSDTWSAPTRNEQVNWNPRRDQFGDLFLCFLAVRLSLILSPCATVISFQVGEAG